MSCSAVSVYGEKKKIIGKFRYLRIKDVHPKL
jgi:hypothetical protein